jgi:hypothetical protein
MNFSYSAVWNDTVALLKSHGSLLLAVAGVFILLPLLMTAYFLAHIQHRPDRRARTLLSRELALAGACQSH